MCFLIVGACYYFKVRPAVLFQHDHDSRHDAAALTIDPATIVVNKAIIQFDVEYRREPPVQFERNNIHLTTIDRPVGEVEARETQAEFPGTPASVVDIARNSNWPHDAAFLIVATHFAN